MFISANTTARKFCTTPRLRFNASQSVCLLGRNVAYCHHEESSSREPWKAVRRKRWYPIQNNHATSASVPHLSLRTRWFSIVSQQQNLDDVSLGVDNSNSFVDSRIPTASQINVSSTKQNENKCHTLKYPFNLFLPKLILRKFYELSYQDQKINFNDCFHSQIGLMASSMNPLVKNVFWTSTFTCPVTYERFEASTVLQLGQEARLLTPQNMDGKVYYKRKGDAEQAAAARALDCYIKRGFLGTVVPERYSVEEPYDSNPVGNNVLSFRFKDGISAKNVNPKQDIISIDSYSSPNLVSSKETLQLLLKQVSPHITGLSLHELSRMFQHKTLQLPKLLWTATFTCPFTEEIFGAGTMKDVDESTVYVIDNEIYYETKDLAEEAAAARALDCIAFRKGWRDYSVSLPDIILHNYSNRCVEDPFEVSSSSLSSKASIDMALNETKCPKATLNNFFQSRNPTKQLLCKSCYRTSSIDTRIHVLNPTMYKYWTAKFIDPETGEVFNAGTLIELDDDDTDLNGQYPSMISKNGSIYYRHKRMAELAAAGRALDSYNLRGSLNHEMITPRYCHEEPIIDPQLHFPPSESLSTSADITDDIHSSDDENDFVIQHVPGSSSDDIMTHRSTMDRIMEAWANIPPSFKPDVLTFKSREMISSAYAEDEHLHKLWINRKDALVAREVDISNALIWYDRISSANTTAGNSVTVKKHYKLIPSVHSVNSVLNALSRINQSGLNQDSVITHKGVPVDIEALAKQVLDSLIAAENDTASSLYKPNVDTFNAYIDCLQWQSGLDSALKAESILNGMLSGEFFQGFKLPEPNVESFNAVMRIWTKIPSIGRLKVDEVFSRLETQHAVRPNRESFLICLGSFPFIESVKVGNDYTTSLNAARKMIEIMETYHTQYGCDYLVNTEVYNAPLPRCSGHTLFPLIPWDDYASLFKDGFSSTVSDPSVEAKISSAMSIEQWLLEMERLSVEKGKRFLTPSIYTYESVIQSWIRTGTKEGLLRGEFWASKAIDAASTDSELTPRLQTFHPIIAAWAASGDPQGPYMIRKWVDQLDELKLPSLHKRDGRLQEAEIIAWRNVHKKLIVNNKIIDVKTLDEVISASRHCTSRIENLCKEATYSTKKTLINGLIFVAIVDSWTDVCVSTVSLFNRDESEVDPKHSLSSAFKQLIDVITILDRLTDSVLDQYNNEADYFSGDDKFQLMSLMINSIEVNLRVIRLLNELHRLSQHEAVISLIHDYLPDVERLLRRSEELRYLIDEIRGNESYDHMEYYDLFSYLPTLNLSTCHSEVFLAELLALFETNSCSRFPSGDMTRMIFFLLNRFEQINRRIGDESSLIDVGLTALYTRVVSVLASVIPNKHEKARIFSYLLSQCGRIDRVDIDAVKDMIQKVSPDETLLQNVQDRISTHDVPKKRHPISSKKRVVPFRRRRLNTKSK